MCCCEIQNWKRNLKSDYVCHGYLGFVMVLWDFAVLISIISSLSVLDLFKFILVSWFFALVFSCCSIFELFALCQLSWVYLALWLLLTNGRSHRLPFSYCSVSITFLGRFMAAFPFRVILFCRATVGPFFNKHLSLFLS